MSGEERERVAVLSVEVAELRRGLESCRMRAALLRKALDEAQDAEETLEELRAQVEALRAPVIDDYSGGWDAACIDVLALLDGGGVTGVPANRGRGRRCGICLTEVRNATR